MNSFSDKGGMGTRAGHGSGTNRPDRASPTSNPATISPNPIRSSRCNRREPVVRNDGTVSARGSNSASPPTSTSHSVATASTTHNRSARAGSVIRVRCHGHPPRLITLNPCSIQLRKAYQHGSAAPGGKSVSTSHGSAHPAARQANSVPASGAVLYAVPVAATPPQPRTTSGRGTDATRSGKTTPTL